MKMINIQSEWKVLVIFRIHDGGYTTLKLLVFAENGINAGLYKNESKDNISLLSS